MKRLLVTGGAGFIGTNFVYYWHDHHPQDQVVVLDKLTYAGNRANLARMTEQPNFRFVHGDIGDRQRVDQLLVAESIDTVVHFAAESHVDRSILGPKAFLQTNVMGTFQLLEGFLQHWRQAGEPAHFRFHHVSTDEVYGSLGPTEPAFSETTPYAPNSPYSASKAGSDHWVRAYHHTYGLPTLITNCSNNYGPYQFPEKLIPLMLLNALQGQPLPIYGDGQNIRDWLYVRDHCNAIACCLQRGQVGETYNIGGLNQLTNHAVVTTLCHLLNELVPKPALNYESLMTFVPDRPGHDRRYAIDASKLQRELGWAPQESFESGLHQTIQWYLDNPDWVAQVQSGTYRTWMEQNYAKRAS